MTFLSPSQQCYSTEGRKHHTSQTYSHQAHSSTVLDTNSSSLPGRVVKALVSPLMPVPQTTEMNRIIIIQNVVEQTESSEIITLRADKSIGNSPSKATRSRWYQHPAMAEEAQQNLSHGHALSAFNWPLFHSHGKLGRISDKNVRRLLRKRYTSMYILGWRFGAAVTRWSRSTQLLYIEPG